MIKQKLSNTKKNKYLECPKKYDLYYNKKIRSKVLSSALFFGVAIDEALNACLESLQGKEYVDPFHVFQKKMKSVNHNGEWVSPETYKYSRFSKADVDISILEEGQLRFPLSEAEEIVMAYTGKGYDKDYNHIAFQSLISKGTMIIEAYIEEVLPLIHTVKSVQETIKLPNDDGDSITGIIDFVASFKDDPETFYIIDNKTASKPYTDKDLYESEQLHLYAYYKELDNVAYIVCEKNIRKRDPRVRITVMRGKTNPEITDKTIDMYEDILKDIKAEKYPKTGMKSGCKFWGNKCEYYSICHNNFFHSELVNMGTEELELDEDF